MKITKDDELGGWAIVHSDVASVIDAAKATDPKASQLSGNEFGMWMRSWSDFQKFLDSPWVGTGKMQAMVDEIMTSEVSPPVNIRRQRRWSETDGEMDVDRALRGTPELFRESFRATRHRIQNVMILVDVCANANHSNESMAWRCAAAVVTVNLLEENGYSCEVWGFSNAERQYTSYRNREGFTAYRVKESGDPLDVDTMSKSLSPEFFRTAVFSQFAAAGQTEVGLGRHKTYGHERWFTRHCEMDSSTEVLWVPAVFNRYAAVQAAKKMIASIQQPVA